MIKNTIPTAGLFATPEDMEYLQDYLSKFKGNEGMVVQVGAWMSWNLASKYADNICKRANDKIEELENQIKELQYDNNEDQYEDPYEDGTGFEIGIGDGQ